MKIINTIVKSRINKRNTKKLTKIKKRFENKISAIKSLSLKMGVIEKRLDNVLSNTRKYDKLKRT